MKKQLPVRVYKKLKSYGSGEEILAKFRVFLKDRPGSLASFSALIARFGGNICFFHYDRSLDSSRVAVEVTMAGTRELDALLAGLEAGRCAFEKERTAADSVDITTAESILEIKVKLENRPGTLSLFSGLLRKHRANVLYMLYDEGIDPDSADVAMATKDPAEIDRLLDAINKAGYHYRVIYRGAGEEEVEHIIGLKLVEKFFLRLRKLLEGRDAAEVKDLVGSSQELHADLIKFYSEAGKHLEAAEVFEKVLTLASMSRSRTGARFSVSEMPPVQLGRDTTLFGFRLPTTENIYVFTHAGELTMIDSGFGIYYDDIKKLLRERSMDPARLGRIFVTHPDADHAGASGHFAGEFGTEVYMHPESEAVIEHDNRAYGMAGTLSGLNKYYTRLVNRFTDCRFPDHIRWFQTKPLGTIAGFDVMDSFLIGDAEFDVIGSRGGHVPGHVFFLSREHGLLFSSDYLINIRSLSAEDKNHLGLYKYLLISPNGNDQVFKEETASLKELMLSLDAELKKKGNAALILPGHGGSYPAAGLTQ
ncbi:MAG: MBL fold metallo-hydrolase [Nitrospiraceae bacterium]|nr:MBL fold metallo-hydrolase [Nitrospiraceae bacterium]